MPQLWSPCMWFTLLTGVTQPPVSRMMHLKFWSKAVTITMAASCQ